MVSIPVSVRNARPDDHAAILALVPRLRAFGPSSLREPDDLDRAEREALAGALTAPRPDAAVLVAELPGLPLAGVAFVHEATDYFTRELHGHLSVLAVAEAAEGRGAGRALIAAAEAWARARGYRFLSLNVFAANARARAFYEQAGFAPDTIRYYKVTSPGAPPLP